MECACAELLSLLFHIISPSSFSSSSFFNSHEIVLGLLSLFLNRFINETNKPRRIFELSLRYSVTTKKLSQIQGTTVLHHSETK